MKVLDKGSAADRAGMVLAALVDGYELRSTKDSTVLYKDDHALLIPVDVMNYLVSHDLIYLERREDLQ